VALLPWAMIWRTDTDYPVLSAPTKAIDELATANDWLSAPPGAWLPNPSRAIPPDRPCPAIAGSAEVSGALCRRRSAVSAIGGMRALEPLPVGV
jgi:hypothetical protein